MPEDVKPNVVIEMSSTDANILETFIDENLNNEDTTTHQYDVAEALTTALQGLRVDRGEAYTG
jgi:hypothetical protein